MKRPRTPRAGTSRRDFLTQTASLAGAGLVLGSCAGLDRPIPAARPRPPLGPDDPVRIGVIGTGGMGIAHCGSIVKLAADGRANVEIAALSDVCRPRLQEALAKCRETAGTSPTAAAHTAVDTYVDHHELLARDDLHAVLIASPEHWHAQMAEDAIAAGKDVYLEKPMTLRLDEALRLRRVMAANPDMILQVGTQYLIQRKYGVAKKLIAEGAIGKPTSSQTGYCRNSRDGEWNYYAIDESWEPGVNLDWERWCGPLGVVDWDPLIYARWRRYREYSTGIVGDLLVHLMTPMVHILDVGWPTRVVASGGHYVDEAMENHDQVNINVEFEGEHTMIVAGSTCNEQGLEIMVRGHKGNLYMGGKDVLLRPERIWVDDVEERKITCEAISDQDELRLDWFNSVRTRRPNVSQVELGTKVMVIVDLATRSMWDGRAWAFDPATLTARAV